MNNSSQNSTDIVKPFEPTKGMARWLQANIDLGYTASVTDISKEADLDRHNWYDWIKDPRFVDWWDQEWQQYLKINRWKLDAIGMKKAEREFNFWHDMQIRVGNLQNKDDKSNTMVQVNTNIDLDKFIKK